ncbi:lytic murein transglycosylase [Nocardia beijingensis]|uniref:lytic transglycosylase domain-containing protein n=1 Tax=Nocardia beijingensis TaxID=95162 RepID=UPI0018934FB7|nr:lytic murein transglycosylase [Nocardia beijingensis]
MRVSAPITVSALVVAGAVVSGSGVQTPVREPAPRAPEVLAAASAESRVVGLLPVTAEGPRRLRAVTPGAPFAGLIPLQEMRLPSGGGALGIPEVVLAAYRNAELALASSTPGCGLSWSLLAGIGRIESGHARGGRTDAAGTTVAPIFGPALDGSLPGNEVIKAADGGYVRALGPMQFLPGTWSAYGADGNGDGVADPHNVFDAALAAGKYLCSGGSDLRDGAQELRAVLRYNNSMAYAANVLSWSAAYRTGGSPTQVRISPDLVAPGTLSPSPDMSAVRTQTPSIDPDEQARAAGLAPRPRPRPAPTTVMITIPGLPPIPCGIFCPPPPVDPCVGLAIPAPMPFPDLPGTARVPLAPQQPYGAAPAQTPGPAGPGPGAEPADTGTAGRPGAPDQAAARCAQPDTTLATTESVPLPGDQPAPDTAPRGDTEPATTTPPAPEPAPVPDAAPTPTPQPGITLPFGIVIPFPAPPAPQQ